MYDDPTGRRNASGYRDDTYYQAVTVTERMEARQRLAQCARAMLAVARALGCDVTARIELRDKKTGEVSR